MDFLIGARLIENAMLKDEKRCAEERYQAAMERPVPAAGARDGRRVRQVLEVVVDPLKARFTSLVRDVSALGARRRPPRHVQRRRGAAAVRAGDGLRRAVPAADPSDRQRPRARARTTRWPRSRATSAAPGRSERRRAATRPILPELGTLEDFRSPGAEARKARHRDRARHRLPVLARPSVREESIPSGSARGPTARSSTPRTRRRNTRTSIRSISRRAAWQSLWEELKSVFEFWVAQGVTIFRVDNPHTKPFAFWEWCIGELKARHPEVIFLSEAFTRPQVMHQLAKLGFTQSYTYFTWRNTKQELIEYFTELDAGPRRASTSGRTSGRTRPTSCTRPAERRARRRSSCASCSPRRSRRTTASTARPTSSSSTCRASPAARSTSTRRSTRSSAGTSSAPTACATLIARLNRDPAREPGAAVGLEPALPRRSTTTQLLAYSKTGRRATSSWWRSTSTSSTRSRGWVELDLGELGIAPHETLRGARPALRRALHLERRAQLHRARSAAAAGARLQGACGDA